MEEQTSLFDIAYAVYKDEIEEKGNPQFDVAREDVESATKQEFLECPKCHVMPKTKVVEVRCEGCVCWTTVVTCPVCKFRIASHYDSVEHWNKCNEYRVRDGEI